MVRAGTVAAPDGRPQAYWRAWGCAAGFRLYEVRCLNTDAGWRPARPAERHTVQLMRSGGLLRRLNGAERFVDATSALLHGPADDLAVAHPLDCGDAYTALEIDTQVLAGRADAERWLDDPGREMSVADDVDLAHRRLLADCRRGLDAFELAERLHWLLDALLGADAPEDDLATAASRRPATLAEHRRLANRAREVIATGGYALGLSEVARLVGCSPHHLSRVFHRTTGQSLSAYRNRVRMRAVLDALDDGGADCLRNVAAAHGFADQPHLTRTLRQHLGRSPSQLRRLLAGPG